MTTTREPAMGIQWKGTDACLDLHCKCGADTHIDGYFNYYVTCVVCLQNYQVATHVTIAPIGSVPE